MNVIVRDTGFTSEDWTGAIVPLAEWTGAERGVDVVPGDDLTALERLVASTGQPLPGQPRDLDRGAGPGPGSADRREAGDTLRRTAAKAPEMIRVAFASFADGRGFTIARRLREIGYAGRLRASGHVLADQYAMARRSGFDEVEIDASLAARQPEPQWRARSAWHAHDYQSRLGRRPFTTAV